MEETDAWSFEKRYFPYLQLKTNMWCFTMKDNRAVFSAWHGLGIWGLFQAAV